MSSHKVVIVTGAAGGMGRAIAELLASTGWQVVATDIDKERLDAWACQADGVVTIKTDVRSREENRRLVDFAAESFGRLDAAVFNAGVAVPTAFEELEPDVLDLHLGVNLKGPLYGIQAVLPLLKKADAPSIAVVASTSGLGGDNLMSAYCSSKFGVVGLVQALAREIAQYGIRINAVCPGAVLTPMSAEREEDLPALWSHVAKNVPLGRWGRPEEIAAVVEFIISPGAAYIHGAALPVDGGGMTGIGLNPPALLDA